MYDEPGDKIEPWLAKVEAINLSHGNQVKTDQIYSTHLGRNGSGWVRARRARRQERRARADASRSNGRSPARRTSPPRRRNPVR